MKNKPNIVFLFADDQRFNTINALGNKEIITPNLDELVARGTAFTQAHIPCGTSGAVCMPSRAMLHSGRTLFHLKDEGQTIPKEHITLGQTLINAGYRAFGTGKWHNGTESYTRSFTEGKAVYFGGMWDHWNVPACDYNEQGVYPSRTVCKSPYTEKKVMKDYVEYMEFGKHSTDLFGEVAKDFINNYDSDDPFFMYLSFMAPHDPRTMPKKFLDMYDDVEISLPNNFAEEHIFDYGIRDLRDEVLAPYPRTAEDTKNQIKEYYAMITHLDYQIGNVIDALKEKGELDNTIIIFSGDNGLALGQHGLFGKQNSYEHSIRVPLIFAGQNIPEGQTRDSYVYLLDIFPTICEMLDIDIPETVEGQSMLSAINNNEIKVREDLYFAYTDMLRSVKNDRYKLIEYRTDNLKKTQLFDIVNDTDEVNDLYGNKEYEEIVEQLKKLLFEYRDLWDDQSHRMGKKYWDRY